jgi:CHASE3 domain sensor protein
MNELQTIYASFCLYILLIIAYLVDIYFTVSKLRRNKQKKKYIIF